MKPMGLLQSPPLLIFLLSSSVATATLGMNLALNGNASQSSNYYGFYGNEYYWGPEKGNNGIFGDSTHTLGNVANGWWRVDFDVAIISKVVVWNRDCGIPSCNARLSNSLVQILDVSDNVVAEQIIPDTSSLIELRYPFDFNDIKGSSVKIVKQDDTPLSIQEVQVYETQIPSMEPSNVPSMIPSMEPSNVPSMTPSMEPSKGGDIESQSQYCYITDDSGTPTFNWNITITEFMSIDKPTTEQGIYNLRSSYILDDRSYDVELFKNDCETAPTGIDTFPLVFTNASNAISGSENEIELEWTYNQTKIESSDLWTANKTGGYSEFCIRVNNYLEEGGIPFGREIHFLEVKYRIEVDSLTDFNETIDILRLDALDGGTEFINYEEEIEVYQCKDDFSMITSPPDLTQGDFLQICVTTKGDSKFGVHSVKELDVSQEDDTPSLYPYVDGFIDSPLAESLCKEDVKNTSAAVCKTKMQLLSAYFDSTDPDALFANGTVKLDYVGRRLSVDVPVSLRYDGDGAVTEEAAAAGRVLAEGDEGPSFGIEVGLSGDDGSASDASLSLLSMGGLFSAGMAFLVAGMV